MSFDPDMQTWICHGWITPDNAIIPPPPMNAPQILNTPPLPLPPPPQVTVPDTDTTVTNEESAYISYDGLIPYIFTIYNYMHENKY